MAPLSAPIDRVRETWRRRVIAEYRSAALTAEMLHGIITLGLSPDTIATCHRIVSDELEHAELSRSVLLAAGGQDSAIAMSRESLSIPHAPGQPLELRLLAATADLFCCGETVALPLFLALRGDEQDGVVEPTAVLALERIVRDEAVHRAFGWELLDELLERCGEPGAAWLRPRVPGFVERILAAYQAEDPGCTPVERGWGLMAPRRYAEITRRCVDEVIRPRFAARGLGPA